MTRALHHERTGSGEPLVLLHGIGESLQIWNPCVPALAESFDVIAVDLPGFGGSAPVKTEPSPQRLAVAVRSLLDKLEVETAHVAGVSLGGWVGLELALLNRARSVVAFSPAGLWPGELPAYCRGVLKALRASAVRMSGSAERIFATRGARALVLPNHGRPSRLTDDELVTEVRLLAEAPGWDATLAAMESRRFRGGRDITVPVTVAWGTRDGILPSRLCQRRDELAPTTRWVSLPGCGHTPTWDDTDRVVAIVRETCSRAAPSVALPGSGQGVAGTGSSVSASTPRSRRTAST
ncbi:MAG TPA: alpha/beta fold hydrolase [Mycobacteriales bacterium]|nr:alpha/beta fold hydrolase [Mycobacteriales bacterium]